MALIRSLIACAMFAAAFAQERTFENPDANKKYVVSDNAMLYDQQVKYCKDRGGNVVQIESAAEAEWLKLNVDLKGAVFFLGTSQSAPTTTWLDNTKMSWTNWEQGNPNPANCQQVFVNPWSMEWFQSKKTARGSCNYAASMICEYKLDAAKKTEVVVDKMAGCKMTTAANALNNVARDVATCS